MLIERKQIERAIMAVCGRKGFGIRRQPEAHAGGKWRLAYTNALGRNANLEIDVVFTLRVPLWPTQRRDSRPVGAFQAKEIPILDLHEIAAGKLVALLSRQASRDLFDAHSLLGESDLDRDKLRLGFVVYGACNRKDWRSVSPADIRCDYRELQQQLIPVLRKHAAPERKRLNTWMDRLVDECRERLAMVLSFEPNEREFLERVLERGKIVPELLTDNNELAKRIRQHPQLLWKALNVRKHRGIS